METSERIMIARNLKRIAKSLIAYDDDGTIA